jgi:hypothetical protein
VERWSAASAARTNSACLRRVFLSLLAAKQGKLIVKGRPQKHPQFEIPAANVNRDNIAQDVHDYTDNTAAYDFSEFYGKWSVAVP